MVDDTHRQNVTSFALAVVAVPCQSIDAPAIAFSFDNAIAQAQTKAVKRRASFNILMIALNTISHSFLENHFNHVDTYKENKNENGNENRVGSLVHSSVSHKSIFCN